MNWLLERQTRDKNQIVIGMVMADGVPIYHHVFTRDTVDPKTFESAVTMLKERFHVGKVILIGDLGF